jgi:serine/threonine protein kinase
MDATTNEALKLNISALLDRMTDEDESDAPSIEGFLWKQGKGFLHAWTKRYYLLSGQCIYYYSHQEDTRPKGVVFLTGSLIERINNKENELKGFYGFEVIHQDLCTGEHHRHDQRLLYCKSEDERDKWVNALQKAAHVVPIEDDYVIGKELGRGRFSVVKECVHKRTNNHAAVKIIDKATMEPEEKVLLRTEIAVLKLVNHPNIICMEGLYESKQHIYIVMEMLKGGELFERIVGRPRFSELEAAKIIRPLLESVAYLHDLGIVHRDLKPENILCGAELDDLKIADFGLSKMVLPKEKMDSACGTLSYVAPEVLTMQGYGKEADLWSVGVIMFLLLCGKLPFDGECHEDIIKSTIAAEIKVSQVVWTKLSEESKSLMQSLLNKNPKDRITARDALKHPFILNYNPHHSRRHTVAHNGGELCRTASDAERAGSPPTTPNGGVSSTPTSSPSETPTTTASAL